MLIILAVCCYVAAKLWWSAECNPHTQLLLYPAGSTATVPACRCRLCSVSALGPVGLFPSNPKCPVKILSPEEAGLIDPGDTSAFSFHTDGLARKYNIPGCGEIAVGLTRYCYPDFKITTPCRPADGLAVAVGPTVLDAAGLCGRGSMTLMRRSIGPLDLKVSEDCPLDELAVGRVPRLAVDPQTDYQKKCKKPVGEFIFYRC